jgi:hypothetical protein
MRAAQTLVAAALVGAAALVPVLAGGQGAPAAPRAPGAPAAPASPTARVDRLSIALLRIDARRGGVSTLVVDLEGALVEVVPPGRGRRHPGPGDLGALARLLAASVPPGGLDAARARDLAAGLAGSLGASATEPGAQVEAALATVREALAGAGVAGPDIVLIERELRRGRAR